MVKILLTSEKSGKRTRRAAFQTHAQPCFSLTVYGRPLFLLLEYFKRNRRRMRRKAGAARSQAPWASGHADAGDGGGVQNQAGRISGKSRAQKKSSHSKMTALFCPLSGCWLCFMNIPKAIAGMSFPSPGGVWIVSK